MFCICNMAMVHDQRSPSVQRPNYRGNCTIMFLRKVELEASRSQFISPLNEHYNCQRFRIRKRLAPTTESSSLLIWHVFFSHLRLLSPGSTFVSLELGRWKDKYFHLMFNWPGLHSVGFYRRQTRTTV